MTNNGLDITTGQWARLERQDRDDPYDEDDTY